MNRQIQTEIIINASAATVWDILTDFPAYPAWNPFIVRIDGRAEAGTVLRNTMLNGGKEYVFQPRITRCEPLKHFAWLGSLFVKGIFDGRHYFEIEALSENSVKLTQEESFSGMLSSMILRRIGDDTRNNFIRMNQALKQRAESF
ncbi:MAG: SRPBCC domain-containing protein [Chitinophagaceae bacterium]